MVNLVQINKLKLFSLAFGIRFICKERTHNRQQQVNKMQYHGEKRTVINRTNWFRWKWLFVLLLLFGSFSGFCSARGMSKVIYKSRIKRKTRKKKTIEIKKILISIAFLFKCLSDGAKWLNNFLTYLYISCFISFSSFHSQHLFALNTMHATIRWWTN